MTLTGRERERVIIENVRPEIDSGRFPVKRIIGEKVVVTADIFADGHDSLSAWLLYRSPGEGNWTEVPMSSTENDSWTGEFVVNKIGVYQYTLKGLVNHFLTWQRDLKKKFDAGLYSKVDILTGAKQIEDAMYRSLKRDKDKLREIAEIMKKGPDTGEAVSAALHMDLLELMEKYPDTQFKTIYDKELSVIVDRERARFSTWYELFPRSVTPESGEQGTFSDCEKILPEIAGMGFDILYLTPIHPIGKTNRKGKNNSPIAEPDDIGSPWAIGSEDGGHKAVHKGLGTIKDFKRLTEKALDHGLEIAIDLAFQCSPDHPYVKQHPEWFKWRPDGTVQYAENPPKKYEDILPLNMETDHWQELWEELKSVITFWIEKGIRIFRVDNPHTKSFQFWEWVITGIKGDYPDVIFLSEAFTRPKVMYRLAKLGFSQSYTYFTWRNTKRELIEYLDGLTQSEVREYFRPNFWTNTPDILPEHLQYGGRPIFMIRLALAATLSSNYGIYGPPFELCVSEALPEREEYLNSEKYEIRHWDWNRPGNIKDFISAVNRIRKENPALQATCNLSFCEVDNECLLFYCKTTEDLSNIILVVVNLDPYHTQSGWVSVPMDELGLDPFQPYMVHDLLNDSKYIWQGERNYVELNPAILPVHIFRVRKKLRRENDFDYYM